MRRFLILLYMLTINVSFAAGQDAQYATISGFVYDASNGEALIGTNVYLEGTQRGSSTNNSGYYVIPRISVGTYTIIAHYIGFEVYKQEITLTASEKKTITVNLNPGNIIMEKVVISGDAIPEAEKLFKQDISNLTLSARQLKQIPQVAETDLLRSLQMLPGIPPAR